MPTSRPIPLNLFGIPFGLLGLGDCWLAAASFGLVPVGIGRGLVAVSVIGWAVVLVLHIRGMRAYGSTLGRELADPIAGPFASLALIIPTLAAADALYPYSHTAGEAITDIGIVATVVLAGWFVGEWIYRPLDFEKVHPGYFLPSVAGGFVASAAAGLTGQLALAQVLFGLGLISWIVVGSIVLGRLVVGPSLPTALIPTLAIEVAPAAVAILARFVIVGHRIDTGLRMLAGYGVLMIVAQVRLLSAFLKLRFAPGFWAFTFSWAAVEFAVIFWLGVTHPTGWRVWIVLVLVSITAGIGAVALRTVVALRRGEFLPAPAPIPAVVGRVPALTPPAR